MWRSDSFFGGAIRMNKARFVKVQDGCCGWKFCIF